MNRTPWPQERRMKTLEDVPERFETKRLSARDAAALPGMSAPRFRRGLDRRPGKASVRRVCDQRQRRSLVAL
ncbi:MAG: hypothetical protein OXD42_13160 [Rhodospirillaceae bacterium]|nr:hypothetical protein [Rhodospirillaceae bacterium]MCY4239841.1 hypothetical protein [Rhodospirillaceae bacterium]